ncbi:hypothetical protein COL30_02190 [Bacillus pseudomycoides]|nr:hypothetical protein CON99_26170 [Bacillus pseudomycoides]PED05613.1 hypothetical protein COO19_25805 [Bacillus pseudomycoides]PED71250.1 hypothetical protein CON97_15355 [Bacillus pseudomycoides]PEI46250.1 hypothetical protein CN620_02090 [Bacillus pseudomycoides]PEI98064.1 hypothetical protein CN686_06065 [Bacillus pseudomycoides]
MLIGLIIVIAMQFVLKRASQNMCYAHYALIEVTITFVKTENSLYLMRISCKMKIIIRKGVVIWQQVFIKIGFCLMEEL